MSGQAVTTTIHVSKLGVYHVFEVTVYDGPPVVVVKDGSSTLRLSQDDYKILKMIFDTEGA